jgi:hypothetical protein
MAAAAVICAFSCHLAAGIIDRTAIVVGRYVILDSDIERDIRVTAFLNRERADFSAAARKQAASRLIDQELIREQIRTGNYPVAKQAEARQLLDRICQDRFAGDTSAFHRALAADGITENELEDRLLWQLTVLRFIDIRFRPQVVVSDEEVEQYYNAHRSEIKVSLEAARPQIVEAITGERVNDLLDQWLRRTRAETHIEYLEKALQ